MSKKLLVILLMMAVMLPLSAFAEGMKKADTIDELVKMFDDRKCMECHPQIAKEWKESFHAKSVTSSLNGMRNFFAIGVPTEWERELTKAEALKCLDCHVPEINYASEKLAVEIANMIIKAIDSKSKSEVKKITKELSKLRVGCISCHNIKATSIAKGLMGKPVKDAVYGVNGKESPAHLTIQTNALRTSLFCAQCHGKYVAADGEIIMCNTLSGSYYNGYVANGGGETCQDCHMKKGKRGHFFPGGHDLEIVKEGIGFNANILGVKHTVGKWIPTAIVDIAIDNKSGHRVPDG
ncbi:MAG: ammonia-forming cytochrome c nitrite reductase subunit c552 [Nitrospirota bacterium]|nr:MAG: ammonia-forming cytochrome c nitrite reductase subunit c552 [Nitrospirota bacterium]